MISPAVVDEVRRLLGEGLSQREIARRTGVSRGSVIAIDRGKTASVPRGRETAISALRIAGPPVRCAGCGGRVYLPCQLCTIRAARQSGIMTRGRERFAPRFGAGG